MGFYPDVQIGEKFVPSAQQENDVRRLLNSLNGFSSVQSRGRDIGARVKVYNSTTGELQAGTPVAFVDGDIVSGAIPIKKYSTDAKNWGVLTETISEGVFSSVIVSGPAQVSLQGGTGDYASPAENGASFIRSETGAPILCRAGDYQAVILLGASSPVKSETYRYEGYFNVKDASRDGKYILRIRGGETDIGWVEDAELDITETCSQIIDGGMLDLDLVAQYINGGYTLHFSADIDYDENITEQYFGNWLIASIYLTDEGKLGIIQQWQNGAIYFGERYWVR